MRHNNCTTNRNLVAEVSISLPLKKFEMFGCLLYVLKKKSNANKSNYMLSPQTIEIPFLREREIPFLGPNGAQSSQKKKKDSKYVMT